MFNSKKYPPLHTVPSVDVNRYLGTWYEIARMPFRQQEGCRCTSAEYAILEPGVLKVINSCMKEGELDVANGKAYVVEGSSNAKLRVQFFWPFRGDYWIIELAEDYSYAVVGEPSRKYCWILSRTRSMSQATYRMLVERIAGHGYDTSKLLVTEQDC